LVRDNPGTELPNVQGRAPCLSGIRLPREFVFAGTGLAITKSDRFQDDSETAVYQFDVRHAGISNSSFAWREMSPVDAIHINATAIRLQLPEIFLTNTFFDLA